MEQHLGLGNQQERPSESLLWWFGGVFDGEGNVSIVKGKATADRRVAQLTPQVRFVTTSDAMAARVQDIWDRMNVPYHVQQRPPTLGTKPVWHLSVNGAKRVMQFVAAFGSYIWEKQGDLQLVRSWIVSRLQRPRNAPYNAHEVDLYLKLRERHGYRMKESSETIRSALLGNEKR